MQIIHGTWIPQDTDDYVQRGAFYLWIESGKTKSGRPLENGQARNLNNEELEQFLLDEVGIQKYHGVGDRTPVDITTRFFTLPALDGRLLKSYELMQFSNSNFPEKFEFAVQAISCYRVPDVQIFNLLKDLHFLFSFSWSETQLGADLLFWYHYTRAFRKFILKDRYIPALKYQELTPFKGKRGKKTSEFKIHPTWEIIAEKYDTTLEEFALAMPQICVAGKEIPLDKGYFFSKQGLLRHFSENILNKIILQTKSTVSFDKRIAGSLLFDCFHPNQTYAGRNHEQFWQTSEAVEEYKKWRSWRDKLVAHNSNANFVFCFKMEAPKFQEGNWKIHFQLQSKVDPSLNIRLDDYWNSSAKNKKSIEKKFGGDLEKKILLNLVYAAKIYPDFWKGLE
ncbi:MAG TPA: ATP-dependent helicase, partial [Saprospiraceae bacterium]|nr:ATP-dependent helicase [Saprospiraceae bacterium]